MPNPAEKTAFIKQKLPTEIIGIICGFSDFKTHTAIRSSCSSVRLYVPLRKVVGFKEYKNLFTLYKMKRRWNSKENGTERVFQERIYLEIHHESLTQDQVFYLREISFDYELCRISRKILDHPVAYKGIDLLFQSCYFFVAAARVGDLDSLIRLLEVPFMNPADYNNRAIRGASRAGRLEVNQFLLQDPRVDPSDNGSYAIVSASREGHHAVVQALLQDPRVDPSSKWNEAIRRASVNGHVNVVQTLLQDPRVDPSDWNNEAIRLSSRNGHLAVVQALLQDPRVDPSSVFNEAIRMASQDGNLAIVQELLKDPRVKLN